MVQLPAFPRDLKRRSRTSPWCRIVRRCPGCTDSSKEPSVQPSFGRVPKYPICHICRYHGAHWSHPGWLGPTLHTCDSHRVSNFWIFWRVMVAGVLFTRCSGWPWWLPSMPLRRDSLWPSKLPPSGRMGRTGTGSAGRRSVVSCQPGLNQQPGKNGQKMWRGHNLQDDFRSIWVCSQPFHLRALEPLLRTSPWRSIRNRCHDGNGGPYLDSTRHFWLTQKSLERVSIFQPDLYWDDCPIAGNGCPGSSLASKEDVLADDLWASMFEAPSNLPV